ncbi:MAG: thermonuclease family protein [Proteobacteria bacterium]|nr:thermonuclease family protein [Pseudomonadota bacterium]
MPASTAALICLVVAIHDGDTLTARCGSPGAWRRERVRIAAIDAPESRQAFGQRARQNLAQLCFRQQAHLYRLGHDHYGRTLAQVRCQGRDVAAAQVGSGLAWVYAPQAARHPDLVALERQARQRRTGLWSQKRPLAPWDYRRQYKRTIN